MHRFLIVEHDQCRGAQLTVRKIRPTPGQAELRMLPAFEATSMGLMPMQVALRGASALRSDSIYMAYHSAAAHRFLAGDLSSKACDDHDPFDAWHVNDCPHPSHTYRYSWYETPENQLVRLRFIERRFMRGEAVDASEHALTVRGDLLVLPPNISAAQEQTCRASFHTTWWQP